MREFDKNGWEEIDENGGSVGALKPNFYCIKIIDAIDHPDDGYLEYHFDIICDKNKDKTYADYFKKQQERFNDANWKGTMRSYYDNDKSKSFFKRNIIAIEKSNAGYDFAESDFDEKTLIGKKCFGTFQEKEYIKDNEVKTIVRCVRFHSFTSVNNGDAKDTEWNKLLTLEDQKIERPKQQEEETTTDFDDDDLPF